MGGRRAHRLPATEFAIFSLCAGHASKLRGPFGAIRRSVPPIPSIGQGLLQVQTEQHGLHCLEISSPTSPQAAQLTHIALPPIAVHATWQDFRLRARPMS